MSQRWRNAPIKLRLRVPRRGRRATKISLSIADPERTRRAEFRPLPSRRHGASKCSLKIFFLAAAIARVVRSDLE
jgi:hypothetical protein